MRRITESLFAGCLVYLFMAACSGGAGLQDGDALGGSLTNPVPPAQAQTGGTATGGGSTDDPGDGSCSCPEPEGETVVSIPCYEGKWAKLELSGHTASEISLRVRARLKSGSLLVPDVTYQPIGGVYSADGLAYLTCGAGSVEFFVPASWE